MSLTRIVSPPPVVTSTLPALKRQWVSYPVRPTGTSDKWFRVLHWNMLADVLAQRGEFFNTPQENLTWDARRDNILHELLIHDPDIISVVEVNKSHFDGYLWREMRRRGYGCLYTPRGVVAKTEIGNVIYYHKGRFFPLLMAGADTPTTYPWGNHAVLRDKIVDKNVIFSACHFTSKEGNEKRRSQEALMLLNTAEHLKKWSSDEHTTILCGDLNAVPSEECVERIAQVFQNAYSYLGPRWTTWKGRKMTDWNPVGGECKRVEDYIFHDVDTLSILQSLDVPKDADVNPSTLLPGSQYPSDHMSLVVDFAWRDKPKL